VFNDESIFHPSGEVNHHNVKIWGTENPREVKEQVWDSPKQNVFWAVISAKVYGPFIFAIQTVTGTVSVIWTCL
jgi:hypothetical protein